jgi:hypothetical protein
VPLLRLVVPGLLTCGVALIGANIGHGALALLSRWGITHVVSYAHSAVIPVLFTGVLLIGSAILIIFGDALAKATGLRGDWFAAASALIARLCWYRFLPVVFTLQIATLFAIESVEQTIAFGHPLGVSAALGTSPFFVLAVQALIALAVGVATLLLAQSFVAVIVGFARAIPQAFRRQRRFAAQCACALRRSQNGSSFAPMPAPLALRIANRPPPLAAVAF